MLHQGKTDITFCHHFANQRLLMYDTYLDASHSKIGATLLRLRFIYFRIKSIFNSLVLILIFWCCLKLSVILSILSVKNWRIIQVWFQGDTNCCLHFVIIWVLILLKMIRCICFRIDELIFSTEIHDLQLPLQIH